MTTTRQIWNVRLGPCWCSTRPGVNGAFDVLRWRIHHVAPELSPSNLVIATAFIPQHVAVALEKAMKASPASWTVVTHRICPQVARRGALATNDLVDVSSVADVDSHLPYCIADQPERLAMTMMNLAATPSDRPRRPLAAL